jgi:hypothetical protein
MQVLTQLLAQQSNMIKIMQDKSDEDVKHGATVRKQPQETCQVRSQHNSVASESGYVDILPKFDCRQGDTEHDMEYYLRSNFQVARLIDENAELRRDKLIRDMITGAEARRKKSN